MTARILEHTKPAHLILVKSRRCRAIAVETTAPSRQADVVFVEIDVDQHGERRIAVQ
jgi:hypothetical protein